MSPTECEPVGGVRGRITRVLDATPIEYATSELSLDVIEAIVIGAQYKHRIEPDRGDEYFTRIDAYSLPRGASPGDLLDGVPLRIGLSGGSELLFAQQFASGAEARSPTSAYLPQRIPLNAAKALALRTGDYVRFAARLHLVASVGQAWPAAALLDAEAEISVVLEGEYEVHFFRLDGDRVRVKLIAQRSRDIEGGLSGSVSPRATELLLDRASERLLPVARLADFDESAALAVSKSADDRFLLDYTLDLSRAEAAAAYDAVFQPAARLTDVRIANPLRGRFELRDRLLSLIEDVDRLAKRDAGSDTPAVTRHFRGARYSTERAGEFRVNLKSFDVTRERVFRQNLLTRSEVTDTGSERRSHFLLPMWSHLRDRTMLFGMLDETQMRTADALFLADEQGNPVRFINIGFTLEYRDGRVRPSEYRALRQKIEILLPAEAERQLAELLSGTPWLEEIPRRGVSISLRYFFRETAFDQLVAAGYGEHQRLEDALVEFIIDGIAAGEYPLFDGDLTTLTARYGGTTTATGTAEQATHAAIVRRIWRPEIASTTASLVEAFTAGADNVKRMNAVLALRNDAFFQRVGTAFWADLLSRAEVDLTRAMFLSLEIDADDHPGISFTYGDPGERELYESVRFLQSVLDDRTFGMGEPGQIEALLSKMRVVRY
jgi:hypothetical protein